MPKTFTVTFQIEGALEMEADENTPWDDLNKRAGELVRKEAGHLSNDITKWDVEDKEI